MEDVPETTSEAEATQLASASYMAPLAYSQVAETHDGVDGRNHDQVSLQLDTSLAHRIDRQPSFAVVGSAMAAFFLIGVLTLVIALIGSMDPATHPSTVPGEGATISNNPPPALATPDAGDNPPPVETIKEPIAVVRQAPRTVYVTPPPQEPVLGDPPVQEQPPVQTEPPVQTLPPREPLMPRLRDFLRDRN